MYAAVTTSAGHGGSAHLAGAMLETMAKVKMTHVPFRGNAPALIDVMSGQATAAEAGFAGFEQCAPWVGMLVPAGTPAAIVNRLLSSGKTTSAGRA